MTIPDERHLPHQVPDATSSDERLMRYATAIARDELDYLLGPEHPLPTADHECWRRWRQTAAVAIRVADREHPPPPGSTVEQLPDDILALIVLRPYVSTACEMARALASAAIRHPDRAGDLRMWRNRMYEYCRQNNKFSGVLCSSPHHQKG